MMGIDTIQLYCEQNILSQLDLDSYNFIRKSCKSVGANGCQIVVRPHNPTDLATFNRALKSIIELEILLDTSFVITRVDLAYNLNVDITNTDGYKYARYLIEAIARRRKIKDVYSTYKGLYRGNIKIKTRNKQVTFYNAKDKIDRGFNSRLEFRYSNLQVQDLKVEVGKRLAEMTRDLYSAEVLNTDLDNLLAQDVIELFEKEMNNKEVNNFHNFLIEYRKSILTKNEFKIIYSKIGNKTPVSKFIKSWENSTGLELTFVNSKTYLELTKILIKELINFKKDVENSL